MITAKDVKYIASLARIHLTEEEIGPLTVNLESILGYIQKLENLDVSDVKPTSHVLALQNVYREDKVEESLSQKSVQNLAIDYKDNSFRVPKVIE